MATSRTRQTSAEFDDSPITDPITALIRLCDLYLHPLNTRSEPPPADIEALADSIAALGLLQNLAGYLDPTATLRPGQTGIVAGGRRLRALQLLVERDGRDPDTVMVPVRIAPDEATARLWASAENEARMGLHPADEVRAYGRMAAAGADPTTIARAFAVPERKVRGRLALAGLPEASQKALREGRISLDQAAALTYAPTEEAGLAELHRVLTAHWTITPNQIRYTLSPAGVTGADRRIKWIGLDAYRQAGGRVQDDLFVDQVLILDEPLLQDLFSVRLSRLAEEMQEAEGWAWVTPHTDAHLSYTLTEPYAPVHRVPIDLPEADAAELAELQERSAGEEMTAAEIARMQELEVRQEGDYAAEDLAEAGFWLYVNNKGELTRSAPHRLRPAKASASDTASGTAAKPDRTPQAVLDDYRILRRLSIQQALLDHPQLVMDLLAVQISARVYDFHRPLALTPTSQAMGILQPDGLRISARLTDAAAARATSHDSQQALHPGHLSEVQAMGKAARDRLLSDAIAAMFCRSDGDFTEHLAQITGADVRKIWTPTAAHFARLPSATLDGIWADLVPPDRAEPDKFAASKKADKAKQLGCLFADSDFREALHLDRATCARIDRWAPPECRWPEHEDQLASQTASETLAEVPADV